MSWSYNLNDTGKFTTMLLDKQLEILQMYYPIGEYFTYVPFGIYDLVSKNEICEIIKYDYSRMHGFYLITIKIMDDEYNAFLGNLKPLLRNTNLKELGI